MRYALTLLTEKSVGYTRYHEEQKKGFRCPWLVRRLFFSNQRQKPADIFFLLLYINPYYVEGVAFWFCQGHWFLALWWIVSDIRFSLRYMNSTYPLGFRDPVIPNIFQNLTVRSSICAELLWVGTPLFLPQNSSVVFWFEGLGA